ncbi:hypothetical protein K491DRAFT_688600 [Lophiostoma macrostomum CBS 122681]|uniref:Uncharacterized protein n=1 Tax=Lophiostoma macrostomum CBS 122681 TaxID=1314788 RepID=A0A6A6TL20_9PLEO|nr:hypothetical protein K491DRAFT_688600 [Lophiostoma macrostomum CBS 122681]
MAPSTSSTAWRSLPSSLVSIATLSSLFLSLTGPAAAFDCKDIQAQGQHFNLGTLGGPHKLHWVDEHLEVERRYNYTFDIDICQKLAWHKGGTKETECRHGTRICAYQEETNLLTDNTTLQPIEIAGTYTTGAHRLIDARFELFRKTGSHADADREGFRAELHGGRFPFDDSRKGLDQQAIIEFVCDAERTGLEGNEKDDGEKQDGDDEKDDDEKKDKDKDSSASLGRRESKCEDSDASLRFCGYDTEDAAEGKDKKVRTLRLEWRTKYACENAPDDTPRSHWGFFTWFIIILFLATAAYLIFGSWLNYNRYGARGWDLLPHGDAIRDIPYVLKDCARKVKDSVQGPGSRGGYSAV